MNRRLPWLLLPAAALAADIASKAWILGLLAQRGTQVVIPGFFSLTLGYNPGAIFGTLGGAPPRVRTAIFVVAGIAAVLYFGWEFLRESTPTLQRVALGLVLGGALGNGLDRFRHGAVVDFLDFEFWGWHYWTFNLADSFIVCGGVLLGITLLRAALRAKAGNPQE
ncbi:signal peptidase II [Mesoterricola silvestris]|uniref:Lipoprotein signal peptidase n=1 Tax=Mesoterricola silvestris TaxID=2927979 RepID=A0AA48KBJ3_9BACT|nr:signal peptidase II [Mesoterricola silvestris]BDU72578.1 lipoprotein signal peptidase [Mesoterricola silvestris]